MNKVLSLKAFIISQVLIFLVSLLFLGGLYYYLNEERISDAKKDSLIYIPVTKKPSSFSLDVSSPEDEKVVFEKSLLVSGKTLPKTVVLVSVVGEDDREHNFGFESNIRGEFSKTTNLYLGLNQITISGFDRDGDTKLEMRTVYYSEEKL